MRNPSTAFICLVNFFFTSPLLSQTAISYSPFLSGFEVPVEVINAGDATNRLFIVQQNGIVRVYDPANGGLQADEFLNITNIITYGGERGLLSAAFHPDFKNNGYFFVYYNNSDGAVTIRRYQAAGISNTVDTSGSRELLSIAKPFDNHNGGHLQFGRDGNLYFATGDGGSANDPDNNAQNGLSLLGKMIRLNVDNFNTSPYYTVPTSNPYFGNASYDSRIWALGLRNPYRWSFDRLTGDMWIGDVGQDAKEEVNYRPASSTGGENYGWRCYEGSIRTPAISPACDPPNYYPPVFDYDNPASGSSSVVGGYVYRGTEYPFFNGYYVAADVYSGNLYLLRLNGSGGVTSRVVSGQQNFVVGFGEAEDGTLYAVSEATGVVYKVVPNAAVLPVGITSFTCRSSNGVNELRWTVASQNISRYIVEYSADGTNFSAVGSVSAINASVYTFLHTAFANVPSFYRLRMEERSGVFSYSIVVKINGKASSFQLYPTVVTEGKLSIISESAVERIQVLTNHGGLVYEQITNGRSGHTQVQLPYLSKGVYFVRIIGKKPQSKMIMVE